jgi:hypothetical protein
LQGGNKRHCFAAALIAAAAMGTATSHALQVNLTTNAPGSPIYGQSFNETRGIDLTVLAASDLAVSSMKLEGFHFGKGQSCMVGARIYDSSTHMLVAAGNLTVTAAGPVTVPIAAHLRAGGNYRVAFHLATTPPPIASGTFVSNYGGFPYTESTGWFRINSAHADPADAFPDTIDDILPLISVRAAPVLKPGTALENDQFVITWPAIIGDQFAIEESSDLTSFTPLPAQSLITAKSTTVRVAIKRTEPFKFYRIRRY